MKQDSYLRAARLYQLLSQPVLLCILDELRQDEACVCHLQAILERPQAYVSQQLRILREAGVVTDCRDGQLVYYRLADQQTERLLEEVLGPARQPACVARCPCPRCQDELGERSKAHLRESEETPVRALGNVHQDHR